jgi:short-subunit dehydrogenase
MLQTFSTVVVTGGSSGIGKSFIEHAAKLHPSLVFINLSRRIPDIKIPELKLCHMSCDLGDRRQTERVCGELETLLNQERPVGRIMLINNSGYGTYGPFPEPNLEKQLEMLDVNMRAPVQLTARLLPQLRARGGAVINLASTAAFQPTAGMATYGATKAFLLHWSLALGEELRGSGVQVLAVCPGPTATEFFRTAGLGYTVTPGFTGQTPEQVVAAAFRALAAGKTMVVSGWTNKLLAAISSRVPKALATRVAARVIERYRGAASRARS